MDFYYFLYIIKIFIFICLCARLKIILKYSLEHCSFESTAKATSNLACEQALLGVGGGREKEERACNDVSGI